MVGLATNLLFSLGCSLGFPVPLTPEWVASGRTCLGLMLPLLGLASSLVPDHVVRVAGPLLDPPQLVRQTCQEII